jgi:hypothetical protein
MQGKSMQVCKEKVCRYASKKYAGMQVKRKGRERYRIPAFLYSTWHFLLST